MFTQKFKEYACTGDTITCTVDGFDVLARIEPDIDADSPDEMQDGFWPSIDPTDAGYIGSTDPKKLTHAMVRAQTIWDAWKNDEWFYCGIVLTVSRQGVELANTSLWGIECNLPYSDNSYYLGEAANELLVEAVDEAKTKLFQLCANVKTA